MYNYLCVNYDNVAQFD